MKPRPFTRAELASLSPEHRQRPPRGEPCPGCSINIPAFADLSSPEIKSLHALIDSSQKIKAIRLLRDLTGCPLTWAVIWVEHPRGPHPHPPERTGPPCPSCGRPLRTPKAKQCLHCGLDWH